MIAEKISTMQKEVFYLPGSEVFISGFGENCLLLVMNTDVMEGEGVRKGDIMVISKDVEDINGKLAVISIGGDKIVRKVIINNKKVSLVPGTTKVAPMEVNLYDVVLLGIVTHVIHKL